MPQTRHQNVRIIVASLVMQSPSSRWSTAVKIWDHEAEDLTSLCQPTRLITTCQTWQERLHMHKSRTMGQCTALKTCHSLQNLCTLYCYMLLVYHYHAFSVSGKILVTDPCPPVFAHDCQSSQLWSGQAYPAPRPRCCLSCTEGCGLPGPRQPEHRQ